MKLTCEQVDILLSFYMDGELSVSLKKQIEEHFEECKSCRTKYEIFHNIFGEIKSTVLNKPSETKDYSTNSEQYKHFHTNLSSYIDNELTDNDNLKIKKFTIVNKSARKELENNYNLKRMMSNSYKKTKNDIKTDFARNTIKKLQLEDEYSLNFNPAIKFLIVFTVSTLVLTAIILLSLSI